MGENTPVELYLKICAEMSGCNPHLKYKRLEKIAFGTTSEVYHGIELSTGRDVAIKVIPVNLGWPLMPWLYREIKNMKAYPHPNIIQYLDSYILYDSLWIVMEYVDGITLADFVGRLIVPTDSLAIIIQHILRALEHLHENEFMHRNIRPENILLGKTGQVKVTDFHLSTNKTSNQNSQIGMRWYMAPELIESDEYDCKIDIWSLGFTLIDMMDVEHPDLNEERDIHAAIEQIIENVVPQIVNNDSVDDVVKDFLRRCLKVDPNLRCTASELLDHDLMKLVPDNCEKTVARLVVSTLKDEREMKSKCCDKCSIM